MQVSWTLSFETYVMGVQVIQLYDQSCISWSVNSWTVEVIIGMHCIFRYSLILWSDHTNSNLSDGPHVAL